RDHQFAAFAVHAIAAEQTAQHRNAAQAGDAGFGLVVLIFGEAAQKVDFAFPHAHLVRYLALADDGLVDAPQVHVAVHAVDIQIDFERDVAVIVDAGQQIHVYSCIDVGELRIDQRVDAHAADARLETAGGRRHAIADLQRGFD